MKYILVNFKTNKNWLEITDYFKEIENFCDQNKINNKKNIFFLTSLHILLAIQKFPVINFGNQSGSHLGMGAYTSTVSIEQLYQDGIKNILLGHSEENKYLGLNEKTTNLKLKKSLSFNFNVFLCFGNEQKENDYDKLAEKLANKIDEIFLDVDIIKNGQNIVLCYEPIFAIGSGNALSVNEVEEIILKLKAKLLEKYQLQFEILYGGSVNLSNVKDFLNSKIIDGVLIGNCGLDVNNIKQILLMDKKK